MRTAGPLPSEDQRAGCILAMAPKQSNLYEWLRLATSRSRMEDAWLRLTTGFALYRMLPERGKLLAAVFSARTEYSRLARCQWVLDALANAPPTASESGLEELICQEALNILSDRPWERRWIRLIEGVPSQARSSMIRKACASASWAEELRQVACRSPTSPVGAGTLASCLTGPIGASSPTAGNDPGFPFARE